MKDTKLIQLVKTFSKEEFREFEKFIDTALYLKRADVKKLFGILKPFYPAFESPRFNYETIHKKLYPGKKFNGSIIRKMSSELFKMAETYLRMRITEEMPIVKIEMMNEFGRRKLGKLFSLKQSELTKYFSSIKQKDHNYFFYKAQTELGIINYNLSIGNQLSIIPNINNYGKYLTYYFLIRILNTAQDIQVNRNLYNAEYEFDHTKNLISNLNIQNLFENLKHAKDEDSKIPEVYYYIYLAYSNFEKDDYFLKAKDLFYNQYSSFSKPEKYNIYLFLENCCTRKIINGKNDFVIVVFELYKRILKEDLFKIFEDEFMGTDLFRNIVITGLKLSEFKWTENFIYAYKKKLDPQQRNNLYSYSIARLRLEEGNFELSLEYISKIKLDYFLFKNDIRNMLLRIYYELNYYEEALSVIDSYKHFLSNNKKVSELNRKSNLNFLKYYTELFKNKAGLKNSNLSDQLNKFNKTKIIGNRKWLNEKFNELM